MMLWYEEDDSDDKGYDDDRPSEWMLRKECEKPYKEIVYRLIDDGREKTSDASRFFYFKQYCPLTKRWA